MLGTCEVIANYPMVRGIGKSYVSLNYHIPIGHERDDLNDDADCRATAIQRYRQKQLDFLVHPGEYETWQVPEKATDVTSVRRFDGGIP